MIGNLLLMNVPMATSHPVMEQQVNILKTVCVLNRKRSCSCGSFMHDIYSAIKPLTCFPYSTVWQQFFFFFKLFFHLLDQKRACDTGDALPHEKPGWTGCTELQGMVVCVLTAGCESWPLHKLSSCPPGMEFPKDLWSGPTVITSGYTFSLWIFHKQWNEKFMIFI